ncbi:hypothetical protein AB0D87_38175 [Streptomyces sp. NPDC048342]|uniref:hypothetical protein n=1 Tax=unclassified Streptomyces TaxID=2593676 RepID=UPI0034363A24
MMSHSPTLHTPALVAAIMRSIGQRRPTLPSVSRGFICAPCLVTWAGEEADCWNCGKPASSEYTRHSKAVDTLLASLGTTRRTRPAPRRSGKGTPDAVIGSALRQMESTVVVDKDSLGRRRAKLLAWMEAGV